MLLLLSALHTYHCIDLTYYVEEGRSPDTYLGNIAEDSRIMDNILPENKNLVRFSQLQQEVPISSQLFRVSKKTGKLYVAQTLDAESLCAYNIECFKVIKVAVRRVKSFLKIIKIKIIIKDLNDHEPIFPKKHINLQFAEDVGKGSRKSIPNAIDRDVGVLNSQITYTLKKNTSDPFSLSIHSAPYGISELSITVTEKLDREEQDSYKIQVIARDGGTPPRENILDVYISVTDINDNPPVFSQSVYNVSIQSNDYQDSPILAVTATDLDSGSNGQVSYHFSPQTSDETKKHFELNEVSGEIKLNRKFASTLKVINTLFVKAVDGGESPFSALAVVLVKVINTQNMAPHIFVTFVSASAENTAAISEDIEVGSFIAYVKVADHDLGQNGVVTCYLKHEKFQLQKLSPKEYKVTMKNPVDREIEENYNITIHCQDRGSPPLDSESLFMIRVMDVNDVRPEFSKNTFKFCIYENEKPNFPIGFINATDPDQGPGGRLTYSLMTNNKQFQITENGLILAMNSLDYEIQDVYKFQVLVQDHGKPQLNNTVNVIIEVRDKNDNTPYFTFPSINPYTMNVLYYPYRTNNITVIKASDSDSRENAFLKFEIISGNEKQLFRINQYTGLLAFNRVVSQHDARSYELELIVKDSGIPALTATTTLFMTLTVSNKTSEMLNAAPIQTGDKIHLYLVISIILVAVIISVAITVSMSICIIRCNDSRNAPLRGGPNTANRCMSVQKYFKCPTHQSASESDVTRSSSNLSKNSQFRNKQKYAGSGHKHHSGSDDIYEICTPLCAINQTKCREANSRKQCLTADNSSPSNSNEQCAMWM